MTFGSVRIDYDEQVLEPRPWTALQSHWAVELLVDAPDGPVLELCCGAGHIGLLVAASTDRRLVAVDQSDAACSFARSNAERAGVADRVEVREGRLEDQVRPDETFALVVADPPWVTSADVARYPDDPLLAIDGGDDGLAVARACIDVCAGRLVPGGSLLLQLGTAEQAERLSGEAAAQGWLVGDLRAGERGVVQQLVNRS